MDTDASQSAAEHAAGADFADFGANSGYVRDLYELYLANASLVSDSWAQYFRSLPATPAKANGANGYHAQPSARSPEGATDLELQRRAFALVESYRTRGHLKAKINPLTRGIVHPPLSSDLSWEHYGFKDSDREAQVWSDGIGGERSLPLARLQSELERIYCGSIGFEFTHITDTVERTFLQSRIESRVTAASSAEIGKRRLRKLVDAEGLESELHRRYVGQKRFSLQGGETAIPMLDTILEACGSAGVREAIIGMSHRGRLNVLANTLGKPLNIIFSEFEDRSLASAVGSGDVKYHLGYQSEHHARDGSVVRLALAPNPSHLEFVNAVVEGIARAKQDLRYSGDRGAVLPILLHGEAAFVGQGIVWETLNLSRVSGYATGGTIHIIVNNQVGFTTTPDEARSSIYSSDIAKAVEAPVFHVNCEDVDAACWVASLALEFRQRFQRDVVIDLYCYRKYGHNEGDDPSFTQPLIYAEIAEKAPISEIYARDLVSRGLIGDGEQPACYESYRQLFQSAADDPFQGAMGEACAMHGRLRVPTPPTGVPLEKLRAILRAYTDYPEGFVPHPKLHKILEKRLDALEEGEGIDWGTAESLAFGSLLGEGYGIRLSGQDCGRGTFSHRHAVLDHYQAPGTYVPLSRFADPSKGVFLEIYNSTLSEAGVMGFEFGYSANAARSLVLWEAQFGDFANGAQVIIDQFLASSEAKWNFLSGLVLLLPHGYEGQGPEHSSARLERFLQLCAEGNMVVAYPSSAAQYFHLLRRQGLMELKRPLVIMTPKSLLRSPAALSRSSELVEGQFEPVIEDDLSGGGKIEKIVLVTGKAYYDVKAALSKKGKLPVSIVRMEQLYPFPQFELKKILKKHEAKALYWVQEEPQNMGAWNYMEPYLRHKIGLDPKYIGRPVSASTAAGSSKRHAAEQGKIVEDLIAAVES